MPDPDPLLSAFREAWQACQSVPQDSLEMEETIVEIPLSWRAAPAKPRRGETIPAFSPALGEVANAWWEARSLVKKAAAAKRAAVSRYVIAQEEAAAAKRAAVSRDLLAREEALAYRIGVCWQEYRESSLGDFAASRISDAEYIEAMFAHYSRGGSRLL